MDGWVRVRAAGKVNLSLRVGPVRPDGYHPLATVFQAVSVYDDIHVRMAPGGEFPLSIEGEQAHLVPTDGRNLAVKAARLLAEEYGDPEVHGAEIRIRKCIPVTGGMAGGSADCAGTLLACAYLWDLDVDMAELAELGGRLGADVPFALYGQSAIGTGRGDHIMPVLSRGPFHWVLAFADFELSTPAVFRAFDELGLATEELGISQGLLEALASGDVHALAEHLVNDLQAPALELAPQLKKLLKAGKKLGALAGIVSGSGPTCAFLAASEADAIDLSARLGASGLCRAVRRVTGPVPGARVL